MSYSKKLIEVALPLKEINLSGAAEKKIRQGHPSGLHRWWARRPFTTARAVLFSQLVDDPSGYVDELRNNSKLVKKSESELHKRLKDWRDKKELFDRVQAGGRQGTNPGDEPTLDAVLIEIERERLFDMIRELVPWKNTTNESVLEPARQEIQISWRRTCRREGKPEDSPMPPFLDPFAGGGAIPLEAQRLGLEAHASDLNPVAVLINKAMIEISPKFADMPPVHPKAQEELGTTGWQGSGGLAEDVKRYGKWIRDEAYKRIGQFYPPYKLTQGLIDSRPDLLEQGYRPGDELKVIAWHWARTVPSPNPVLNGKQVPLISSFWLSKKKGKKAYLEPVISNGKYTFKINVKKPEGGILPYLETVNRKGGVCLISGAPMPFSYIRKCGKDGKIKNMLLTVVCEGKKRRVYLPPDEVQLSSVDGIEPEWKPMNRLPQNTRDFKTPNYGLNTFGDLFTDRQLTALGMLTNLVNDVGEEIISGLNCCEEEWFLGRESEYIEAVSLFLALGISKYTDSLNSLCPWEPEAQCPRQLFGRQAIPMLWDFAEGNPFGTSSGSFLTTLSGSLKGLSSLGSRRSYNGTAYQKAAQNVENKEWIISTDPPYYDNIGYADLSDFFYVWLRQCLKGFKNFNLETVLAPKEEELIADPYRKGGKAEAENFFMDGMTSTISNLVDKSSNAYPICFYYAFKQSEKTEEGVSSTGWATFLQGLIDSELVVISTWPLRTESTAALKNNLNFLASSILLTCRKKEPDSPISTRREFIEKLRKRLPVAIQNLQLGNVAPVDLPQSAIGPGVAIFSNYSKVIESDGSSMKVATALQLINEEVDEVLSAQEANMDSWTRFAVTWFSQNKFDEGSFGDAETLATARVVTVDGVQEAGILKSGGGKVRLLKRDELDPNWDPATDTRLTVWEVTHYLIREILDGGGEMAAAKLLKKVGGLAEDAKGLAYRLYTICEQNKWAELGRDYNMLVSQWPELVKQAQELESEQTTQSELGI